MAKCCRKKRNQTIIEKKVADDIELAESAPTLTENEDDLAERRTANMLDIDNFAGREQQLYVNHKKVKLNARWTSSVIVMPVDIAEIKRLEAVEE